MDGDTGESEGSESQVANGPGMLTSSQREYIIGESDVEKGSQRERTIRSRIRERLVNGINDLDLALWGLDKRDLGQVETTISGRNNELLQRAAGRLLAFSALSVEEASHTNPEFEKAVDANSIADIVVNLVPHSTERFFHEYLQSEYIDHERWTLRDSELNSNVGFDYANSDSPSRSSAELQRFVQQYEMGEITKDELIRKISDHEEE
jgi:hypothetical protein